MILLSCPACARQYDVTHLPPRSPVRCACDEVFHVEVPKRLWTTALACTRCGGAVGRTDERCPWCGAGLSAADRARSTLCPKCFTRIADEARHCASCGVAIAPQALTPIPAGRACPRCGGGLAARALETTSVIECTRCRGTWLSERTFAEVCRSARERPLATASVTGKAPSGPGPESQVAYIPCLACGELMHRRMYRYGDRPSRIVVDACREHGVWLDAEELEHIVRFLQTVEAAPRTPAPPLRSRPVPPLRLPDLREREAPIVRAIRFLFDLLVT